MKTTIRFLLIGLLVGISAQTTPAQDGEGRPPRVRNSQGEEAQSLTTEQNAQWVSLAAEQEKLLTDLVYKWFPLIRAFCRQLAGDIPAGSSGLNRGAVMKYTADLFEIDGLLSYRRAQVLGGIVRSLTDEQKPYLGKMAFNNSATTSFVLRSPEVADDGPLPKDYTGDGTSSTLPLEWSGAPAGTQAYALIMQGLTLEAPLEQYIGSDGRCRAGLQGLLCRYAEP